jgi:putative ABC transport system ATP-binding protein
VNESSNGHSCLLEAKRIRKTYGDEEMHVEALRGVDLSMCKGEFAAIMGPSGSGKSTMLHILGGIDLPTSGQVVLDGTDLAALDDDERTILRRTRLGFIFQAFNLLPILSALENVSLPLELAGMPATEARRKAEINLELVGMLKRASHLPGSLSGGEQQRVAIARALSIEPVLLLADEPTGNLDSAAGIQVIMLLRKLVDEHQHTVVMVTHDHNMAAHADRCIHMRDGLVERISGEPKHPHLMSDLAI